MPMPKAINHKKLVTFVLLIIQKGTVANEQKAGNTKTQPVYCRV